MVLIDIYIKRLHGKRNEANGDIWAVEWSKRRAPGKQGWHLRRKPAAIVTVMT